MTNPRYGDKSPKSVPSRIFAMIWIQTGLIVMAIFMAVITSALTSVSLGSDTKVLHGSTVRLTNVRQGSTNGLRFRFGSDSGFRLGVAIRVTLDYQYLIIILIIVIIVSIIVVTIIILIHPLPPPRHHHIDIIILVVVAVVVS